MPLPAAMKEAARSKAFWLAYVLDPEGAEWPALGRRCRVDVPVGGDYALAVDLGRSLSETILSLRRPRARRTFWMGQNDLAYWPRDVLRWEETGLICRAAAALDPDFAHPGVVLLLLAQFTPLTVDDRPADVYGRVREAFESVAALAPRTAGPCARRWVNDCRTEAQFGWRHDGRRGYVFRQTDIPHEHHLDPRCPDGRFPFAEFGRLLDAARETCSRPAPPAPRRSSPTRGRDGKRRGMVRV